MKILLVTFLGLPAATLVGAFLAAGAVTTLLYVLKLRRRSVSVAFLPLWEKSLVERQASALRSRLQRLFSLLLSLLIVAALILALGDPRPEGEEEKGRTIAVLLDVSSSMGAEVGDESRLDVAKKRVEKWFAGLGPGDQMLLVEVGARPRPLLSMTGDRAALSAALSEVVVLDVSADLRAALAMTRDALRGRERTEVILVSDGALPPLGPEDLKGLPPLAFESVAGSEKPARKNVGVTSFSARRYPLSADRFEVLIELLNSGEGPAQVEVGLYQARADGSRGQQIDLHRLTLPENFPVSQSYENLDHVDEGLIAEVRRVDGSEDPFLADNIARTLLAKRVPARVLVVGPPNNFLDAALLVEESLQVVRMAETAYPPSGKFDITIFDGVFPAREKRTGAAVYLGVPPVSSKASPEKVPGYPVELGGELKLFGFDSWNKDSTVFRLIDPYNIQVLKGRALKTLPGDVVLGASEGKPIFVAGERPEGRFLALGFSPRDSDFVLRTAFPLFILNLIDELFPRGRTDAALALQTGSLWRPPVPVTDGSVEVRGPLGEKGASESLTIPVDDGHAVLFGQRAGFYEVKSAAGTSLFAASVLSSAEAEIAPSKQFLIGKKPLPAVQGMEPRADRKPWFWLLTVVLLVSFLEWWSFHRRWTV